MNSDDEHRIDRHLIVAVQRGEAASLERLYDRHSVVALTVIQRIVGDRRTAEDVLQEAFLQVWRRADTFDSGKGTVRGWILAISHNLGLNEIRRRRSRPVEADPSPDDQGRDRLTLVVDPGPSPEDLAWLSEQRSRIATAITGLPEAQQTVIRLYAAGYSQSEIAIELDKPIGSVKTWMRRGMQQLRSTIGYHPTGNDAGSSL